MSVNKSLASEWLPPEEYPVILSNLPGQPTVVKFPDFDAAFEIPLGSDEMAACQDRLFSLMRRRAVGKQLFPFSSSLPSLKLGSMETAAVISTEGWNQTESDGAE